MANNPERAGDVEDQRGGGLGGPGGRGRWLGPAWLCGAGVTHEFGLYLTEGSGFTDGLDVGHETEESKPNQVTTE